MQRIPLTSKERKSMGRVFFCFVLFLKLRGNEIYIRKSCLDLAGYHWTQETDHGRGGWELSLLSQLLSLLLQCYIQKRQRKLNCRGRD